MKEFTVLLVLLALTTIGNCQSDHLQANINQIPDEDQRSNPEDFIGAAMALKKAQPDIKY